MKKDCVLKKDSYIQIQPFMVTNLNLSGNSLIIYAAIYGVTVNKGVFYGSLEYLAKWCNCSTRNVINCLDKLLEAGLIKKKKTNRGNVYISTPVDTDIAEPKGDDCDFSDENEKSSCEKSSPQYEKSSCDEVKKVHTEGEKSSHNILDITSNNNLDLNTSLNTQYAHEIFELWKNAGLPCCNQNEFSFISRDFKLALDYLKGVHSADVIQACKNYITVLKDSDSFYKNRYAFDTFVSLPKFKDFLPERFVHENFKIHKFNRQQTSPQKGSRPYVPVTKYKLNVFGDTKQATSSERPEYKLNVMGDVK